MKNGDNDAREVYRVYDDKGQLINKSYTHSISNEKLIKMWTASENSESTDSKEICNIVAMKKELEYLKLKESIQVYKNKIIYNDM